MLPSSTSSTGFGADFVEFKHQFGVDFVKFKHQFDADFNILPLRDLIENDQSPHYIFYFAIVMFLISLLGHIRIYSK